MAVGYQKESLVVFKRDARARYGSLTCPNQDFRVFRMMCLFFVNYPD